MLSENEGFRFQQLKKNSNTKWFDKPFDRLTVLSKVEGLTTLSQVEGQITMTEFQTPKPILVNEYSMANSPIKRDLGFAGIPAAGSLLRCDRLVRVM
jgi:hypothetical protein